MRFRNIIGALAGMAACASLGACADLPRPAQVAAYVACEADGVLQPIAAADLNLLAPGVGSLETLLLHPRVVAWCAAHGGVPVPVVTAPPAAPAAPAAT